MMDPCVELNNVGVMQLETGRYDDAIESFTNCLGIMKQSMGGNLVPATENQDGSIQRRYLCQIVLSPFHQPISESQQIDKNSTPDGLYLASFQLSRCCCRNGDQSNSDAQMSLAIIFNLALAQHLSAIFGCNRVENRKSCLARASALYRLTYTSAIQDSASSFLTLAAINNLGHVKHAQGRLSKADQCFRHLLSMLFALISNGETESEIFDEFLLSVSYLILTERVAPAA